MLSRIKGLDILFYITFIFTQYCAIILELHHIQLFQKIVTTTYSNNLIFLDHLVTQIQTANTYCQIEESGRNTITKLT